MTYSLAGDGGQERWQRKCVGGSEAGRAFHPGAGVLREGFLEERALTGTLEGREEQTGRRDSPEPKDGEVIARDLPGEAGSLAALLPCLGGGGWGEAQAGVARRVCCRGGPREDMLPISLLVPPPSWMGMESMPLPSTRTPSPPRAGLPRGSGSLRPRGTGASTELVFGVLHPGARPRPQPFRLRSLARPGTAGLAAHGLCSLAGAGSVLPSFLWESGAEGGTVPGAGASGYTCRDPVSRLLSRVVGKQNEIMLLPS